MVTRRSFLRGAAVAGSTVALSPLQVLAMRSAAGEPPSAALGYGPLVNKGDLWLPAAFNYQIIDRQGGLMRDGRPTPGIFDAMGAFPDVGPTRTGATKRTILIRNHENRERAGEIKDRKSVV